MGQAVGIDPTSGKVWFGQSSLDIWERQQAAGDESPLYVIRVGKTYYGRRGGAR
jgi:hypothetical protein